MWGKLPGYDWWPGCVISYDKKELDKFREEMDNDDELETGPMEEEDEGDIVTWVKWFGDNQLSLVWHYIYIYIYIYIYVCYYV